MELLKARKGYLTILKGRPATGKTSAALLDMLNRAYLDDYIMYFTYESSQRVIYKRLLDYFDFDLDDKTNINVVDLINCGFNTISEIIRFEKPSFVYIDYCGLIRILPETEELRHNYEKQTLIICQELSKIAKELDIAIVLLMQQRRDYEKEKRIEIAFDGELGFKTILDGIQYDNLIPMFLERSYDIDLEKATIYLFDLFGKYEKYSEFNVKDIYRRGK